jgi:hypothetical protein
MARYKLVTLTGPVEGREDEYNNWYQNIHLAEVVALPGFKSVQRYRIKQPLAEHETFPYLAIYDIETDDFDAVLGEMQKRASDGSLSMSDALGQRSYAVIYEEFGAPVKR